MPVNNLVDSVSRQRKGVHVFVAVQKANAAAEPQRRQFDITSILRPRGDGR